MIANWFQNAVEWRNFGWNASTVSFIGTVVFTFLEGWGLYEQNKTIRTKRSGESVSVMLFSYLSVLFLAFAYYGVGIHSVATVFNGVSLAPLYIAILVNLWKYKGFTRKERVVVPIFFGLLVLLTFVSWKDTLMTAILMGSLLPFIHQAYEMWRNKSVGSMDLKFLVTFTGAMVFWTVFAFSTGNIPLMATNPVGLSISAVIFVLWYKYRKNVPITARP